MVEIGLEVLYINIQSFKGVVQAELINSGSSLFLSVTLGPGQVMVFTCMYV